MGYLKEREGLQREKGGTRDEKRDEGGMGEGYGGAQAVNVSVEFETIKKSRKWMGCSGAEC